MVRRYEFRAIVIGRYLVMSPHYRSSYVSVDIDVADERSRDELVADFLLFRPAWTRLTN